MMIIIGATITPALIPLELEVTSVAVAVAEGVTVVPSIVVSVVKVPVEGVLVEVSEEVAAINVSAELDVLVVVTAMMEVVADTANKMHRNIVTNY